MDILAALLVLVCLIGILFVVVGAVRPKRGGAKSMWGLGRYATPGTSGGLVAGLVAAVALNTFAQSFGADAAAAGTLGVLAGGLFAALPRSLRDLAVSVAGAFGVIGLVVGYFTVKQCAAVSPWLTVAAMVVVLIAASIGGSVSFARGRSKITSVLGLFSALSVVKFLSSPLGISLLDLPGYGWIVSAVAAVIFGWAAGFAPNVVIAVAALAIAVTSLGIETMFGDTCEGGVHAENLAVVVCFVVVYLIVRSITRAFGVR